MDQQTGPAAVQNLEYLRQLIAEARAAKPEQDVARLRMVRDGNLGINALTTTRGDRQ
jgi:hypothetical protein